MQASAGTPIEAAPLAQPELKPALQLLPQADFQRVSRMANDALYLSQPLRQGLTEPEITKRLTSIPELNTDTRSGLATTISLHVETIDQTQRDQNDYLENHRQKEGMSWAEEHVYPGIIDNLELVAAVTHENPQQKDLHDQAVEAKKRLVPTTEVIVKYADGNEKTHTLAEWDDILDQEALKLWRKISPAATLNEFRSNDKMDPMTRFGFRLQAKQALLGTKPEEINKEVKVKFSYLGETVKPKPKEPPPTPEAEKPEDRLMQKAKVVAREIQTQNGKVDTMTLEELTQISPNENLARLEIFLLDAEKASGPQREYFLSAIYEELQSPGLTGQLPEAIQKDLATFLQSKDIAGDSVTTIGVAQKGRRAFTSNVIIPLLRSNYPQEYTTFAHELDHDKIFRNFFSGLHFQGRNATPEDIRHTLNAQMREGLTFTTGDTAFIQAIADKDNSEMVEAVLTGMVLDVKELKNLPLYGEAHAKEIVDLVATPEERALPDWETSQAKNNRIIATKRHFAIDEIEIKKKRKLINPKFLMSLGGAAMIITMFQNTLGFGVFGEEQEQGGHRG